MLLEENLKAREQVALSTGDFLSRQLNEAKQNLDEQDRKLANFKRQYLGQLPGDVDDNLKILMTLNSQLDANTQMLNRAQEDKSFTESVLAQQIAAWKSSQASLTSETMEQQLAALQTQLVALQARYTDDHPEVVKAKNDIAALEAKQKAMISSAKAAASDTPEGKAEPPEILQLRQEIHQYEDTITRGTSEQKSLQEQIATGRSRLAISPEVEEQYKQLTRDSDTAHTLYDTLLANKSESAMQTDMEHQQQGEHMTLLDPADLPASPSFPNRWQFAGGGLGAGLALGVGIAMWLEFQNKAMRDEKDVQAALELPTLTSVPWVGSVASRENSGFSDRFRTLWDQKKTAGV